MRVHHLALRTTNVARLEAFYTSVLGLAVTRRQGERSVWLAAGDTIVMLEKRDEGEPPIDSRTMELVAFAIEPAEARAIAERIAAAGLAIEARSESTLYLRDPDGRRVGLSAYPQKL